MMWLRLAQLRGCSVDEARNYYSEKEFRLWCAWYRMNPWGEERADLRNGILCATIARVNGSKKAKPSDFMPKFDSEVPKNQSADAMAAVFNSFRPPVKT